jgi:hypothetical protein
MSYVCMYIDYTDICSITRHLVAAKWPHASAASDRGALKPNLISFILLLFLSLCRYNYVASIAGMYSRR